MGVLLLWLVVPVVELLSVYANDAVPAAFQAVAGVVELVEVVTPLVASSVVV
jgi:hypothetical protein